MINSPLIRPAISWGKRSFGGGTLRSHDPRGETLNGNLDLLHLPSSVSDGFKVKRESTRVGRWRLETLRSKCLSETW